MLKTFIYKKNVVNLFIYINKTSDKKYMIYVTSCFNHKIVVYHVFYYLKKSELSPFFKSNNSYNGNLLDIY